MTMRKFGKKFGVWKIVLIDHFPFRSVALKYNVWAGCIVVGWGFADGEEFKLELSKAAFAAAIAASLNSSALAARIYCLAISDLWS